ncbi:MAG: hypothetical protein KAH57_09035 [Thermoplasmata archaeon]|nr:hypothetical protein [Thermoplasmata archaeon]
MKFFSKNKIRFETITVERRSIVFRALEGRGWTLITDPYQIDMDRTPEKLRKIAMKNARELHGELVVETWDPLYLRQPYKGLTYSAWRQMTPEEIQQKKVEREKDNTGRPDYSDTMGTLEDLSRKMLEKPKLQINTEDMNTIDQMAKDSEFSVEPGMVYGSKDTDMEMVTANIETVSVENPYDHYGETGRDLIKKSTSSAPGTTTVGGNLPGVQSGGGPVFDESKKLELLAAPVQEELKEVDPLAMMMAAADEAPPDLAKMQEKVQTGDTLPSLAVSTAPKVEAPPVVEQEEEGQ